MQVRIKDKKIQKLVKLDAKARHCSNARAVEMALSLAYQNTKEKPVKSLDQKTK